MHIHCHTHFFLLAILTRKVGQIDLVFNQVSSVGLRIQDYKCLCAAATICATLVNIQTHRQTDNILTSLYE